MLDAATAQRDSILKALPGMTRQLHTNSAPPAKVKPDGSIEDAKGPVGFSAALVPYLSALGEKNLESEQVSRMQSELDNKTGPYGKPPKYYDQNLILFGLGWKLRQFWFDSTGALMVPWRKD